MTALDDKTFTIQLKKPFRADALCAAASASCFIMPERVAKTDPFKQITETVGSGPFKFVKDEWVAGARAAWVKNDKYIPRDEPAGLLRRRQAGLRRSRRAHRHARRRHCRRGAADRRGRLGARAADRPGADAEEERRRDASRSTIRWVGSALSGRTSCIPPFDNRKLLRAILPAIDQREFLAAVIGEQSDLGKLPAGFFTVGSKMANMAGLEALSGPRDVAKAKRLVAESGYKGEPVLLMSPTDQPALAQVAQVTRARVREGRHQRRLPGDGLVNAGGAARLTRAAGQGRLERVLHLLGRTWPWPIPAGISRSAATAAAPGSAGRPTQKMEALRDAWFDAPDLPRRRRSARTCRPTRSSRCRSSRSASGSIRPRSATPSPISSGRRTSCTGT